MILKTNDKIAKLRDQMKSKGIDAYIIPTADAHQSEYPADYFKERQWISGFTGSAGTALVTLDKAFLWTDGRYFIQAEKELGESEFQLMKMGVEGVPSYGQWLSENLAAASTVSFKGQAYSQAQKEELEKLLNGKDIEINNKLDLIGEIWSDRPDAPMGQTFVHELKYTGLSAKEKIQSLREVMEEAGGDYNLIASLDDIAWLYNFRGGDIRNFPVAISYALLSMEQAHLFIDKEKVTESVEKHFEESGIEVHDYQAISQFVEEIPSGSKLLLDKTKINSWLYNHIDQSLEVVSQTDISSLLKGNKNQVEINNLRNAYHKDGLALVNFFYWLENKIGKEEITELDAAHRLLEFRKEQEGFLEASFNTISAYGPNAALPHYAANPEEQLSLQAKGLYLVDSGGQYLDGTTDITRVMALGTLSDQEKRDFTLTLKGHINLIDSLFLEGTNGYQLDVLCRQPLWKAGEDYKHGTGHGIGYLLNVHEGPHRLANVANDVALEKGMVLSIEPGIYKAGSHGVRIENIVVVDEDIETEAGQFLNFDILSYVPIDLNCIEPGLLNEDERDWLNKYHEEVYQRLSLDLSEEVKDWLKEKTKAI